ncbi:MAG: YgjV family protein [Proteobacteria bacterium]|nr:YgjV family protein [Pseudomonadota bacterium]
MTIDRQITAQIIGFAAFFFGVYAFVHKNDRYLKKLLIAQSFILTLHFFLLGAHGAIASTFVSGLRLVASLFGNLRHLAPLFIILYIVLGFIRYQHWYDAVPILGSCVSTIGFFYCRDIKMRLCSLFSTCLWIIHNTAVGSVGPLLMEITIFVVNLRTILTLSKAHRKVSPGVDLPLMD